MILGTWEQSIDQLGRMKLPAALQPLLAEGLVATRSFDPCVQLIPRAAWEDLSQRVGRLPLSGLAERRLRRLLFAAASELNDQGEATIVLSPPLRAYAAITSAVVIVGTGTYLELWSPTHWAQLDAELISTAGRWPASPTGPSALPI